MSRDALVEAFSSFPRRLAEATTIAAAAVADEARPVAPGEWGPSEVVRHLIAVETKVWATRFADIARSDDPHWGWTEPGLAAGFDDQPLPVVLAAFASVRAATTDTIAALDEDGWRRSGTHATYGRLDVAGLLRVAIDHDESHLEGVRARPGD